MNQSEQIQAIQRTNQNPKQIQVAGAKRGKTRAGTEVVIGFGFTSDWLKKWRESFFRQSQSVAMQNESNCEFIFDTHLKTGL